MRDVSPEPPGLRGLPLRGALLPQKGREGACLLPLERAPGGPAAEGETAEALPRWRTVRVQDPQSD